MFTRIFVFLSFLFTSHAFAVDWSLLEVRKVSVEQYKIRNKRGPYWDYIPQETGEQWASGGAFNLNLDVLRIEEVRAYVNNRLSMDSTEAQIRAGAWQFQAGVNIYDRLDFSWRHHSQHLLDATPDPTRRNYPLWDSYNVELIILKH